MFDEKNICNEKYVFVSFFQTPAFKSEKQACEMIYHIIS